MTWWTRLIRRDRVEAQLDAELRDHLERSISDYVRAGLSDHEARRRALIEFGGVEQVKEACRDARGTRWLDELLQDLAYAARVLRKAPAFTAVTVVTLAAGIGAAMAIFNLVDALLLRPLPVPNAGTLLTLTRSQSGATSEHFSYPQIRQLAERSDLFESLAGIGSDTLSVGPVDALEPVGAAWVSGHYFSTLGLTPAAGRLLREDDDRPGAEPAAVISHDYWERRFSAHPGAVGASMLIEGVPVAVVGVTPAGFTGATVGERADITLAIASRRRLQPENASFLEASARWLRVLARPASTLPRRELQARLDVIWPQILQATLPQELNAEGRARTLTMTLTVESGANGTSQLRARFRRPLTIALALVSVALVIACVNVGSLLLSRGAMRSREIALRCAIGAGRGRIVRQLLTENALLGLIGTAAGVVVGAAGSAALVQFIGSGLTGPDGSALSLDVAFDWRALGIAAATLVTTTLLFGTVPAWRASLAAPQSIAASSPRVTSRRGRLGPGLIAAQVALSLAIIVGAGLFARTLHNLYAIDRGFRTDDILLVRYDPRRAGYTSPQLRAFHASVLEEIARLPGIRAASIAAMTPLQGGGMSMPMRINGTSTGGEDVYFNVVGPRYFAIMQTPLLAGRDFTSSDDDRAPAVALVNEAFVRRYFAGASALGQRVAMTGTPGEMEIVGIVTDAAYETLRVAAPPTVYTSYLQHRGRPMTLVIDTADAAVAVTAIRSAIQAKVPARPLHFRMLAEQLERSLVRERLLTFVSTVLAAVALILATVGLYAVVSSSVSARRREIGVRLALGATPAGVETTIVRDALRLIATGAAVGLPIVWLLSRVVRGATFGVTPADPVVIAGALAALVFAGLLAALAPARRAARIDPVLSLRAE